MQGSRGKEGGEKNENGSGIPSAKVRRNRQVFG